MRAGGFATGSAMLVAIEHRHDHRTAHTLAKFRARLRDGTDAAVLDAAAALERPHARRHPLCADLRQIVDAELRYRHLSLSLLAGGAR